MGWIGSCRIHVSSIRKILTNASCRVNSFMEHVKPSTLIRPAYKRVDLFTDHVARLIDMHVRSYSS